MTPGKFHPWHSRPSPSCAAREAQEEVERVARIEAALVKLADAVEALDPAERDAERDARFCAAVVASTSPRKLALDE